MPVYSAKLDICGIDVSVPIDILVEDGIQVQCNLPKLFAFCNTSF